MFIINTVDNKHVIVESCWFTLSLDNFVTVFKVQLVFANEVLWQHIMLCRNVLWSGG